MESHGWKQQGMEVPRYHDVETLTLAATNPATNPATNLKGGQLDSQRIGVLAGHARALRLATRAAGSRVRSDAGSMVCMYEAHTTGTTRPTSSAIDERDNSAVNT